jgi:crotonobetainyl-CoA:carnitine CoA-transferase CaiB-like acyl-CoA transferase
MFDNAQARENGMFWRFDHPEVGGTTVVGPPLKLSRTPLAPRSAPPGLGEHTTAVLAELGYSREEIRQLHERRVVSIGPNEEP